MRIAAACLVLLTACGKTADPPPIVWHDLASGEALARREHRPVVVFVHATWSTADVMLEREVFPSPEVRRAMSGFVAIDVDASDDELPETRRAQNRFQVVGVPTIIVTDDLGAYPHGPPYPPEENPAELFRANELLTAPQLATAIHRARARSRLWVP